MWTLPPIVNGVSTSSRNHFGSTHPPPPAFVSHCTQTAYCPDSRRRSELRNVENASAPGYTRLKYVCLSVNTYQFVTKFAVVKSRRGVNPSSGLYSEPARVN